MLSNEQKIKELILICKQLRIEVDTLKREIKKIKRFDKTNKKLNEEEK